ncbi:hypothetical protein [Alkaliphilus serpentinus]|uniref:Uncharacterized protein n=1 Tax=Alkaliphilus serpentinus TaxID=1482731 RepID=A0A833MAQ4_9FIRM|nr:hypothetical protein [Alkaliphilus serpentinus]KAB3531458.1 hypothetical protein F8153_04575 [Alkaliphilus serpentinus]
MKNFFKGTIVIVFISFALFLIHDYWQVKNFSSEFIGFKEVVSYGVFDVLISFILFLFITLLNKDLNWLIRGWKIKDMIIILQFSLLIGLFSQSFGKIPYEYGQTLLNTDIKFLALLRYIIIPLAFFISSFILKITTRKQDKYRIKF